MATPAGTIVYASYVSPFPVNSGERIRLINMIKALRSLGYAVEAFVGNHDGVDLQSHNSDGVRFHRIPFDWPRLRQSASIYFKPHGEFTQQVLALHQARPLTAIFLDYGYMGAQITALAKSRVPVVMGTHNVELMLTGRVPWTSPVIGLGLRLRQAIEIMHERWFFRKADAVICVSEEDRRTYARFVPAGRLHVVPNFADIPDIYEGTPRQNRIIMSGSFDNFQNMDGLRWFVENVWDDTLRAHTQLCIAGKQSDRAAGEFSTVSGITGLGARDDLLIEIARSQCAIVPVHQGGGTRFKCLEAMAVRTPLVSTAKGCEGLVHDGTIRVADTAETFRAAILEVLAGPDRARQQAARARAIYEKTYGLAANAARLEHVIAGAAKISAKRRTAG